MTDWHIKKKKNFLLFCIKDYERNVFFTTTTIQKYKLDFMY